MAYAGGRLSSCCTPIWQTSALIRGLRLLSSSTGKAAEEARLASTYTRQSPREHVLLRPGMYIGSTEPTVARTFVYDDGVMLERDVEYSPAFLKIFDEILVNAADNRVRGTRRIEVSLDQVRGRVTVSNDGAGLPVVLHPSEGVYIPELVFGHLLTGSNFDDSSGRITGGRHGYGAKLTNIMSREFTVTTVDPERGLRYTQTWRDNMGQASSAHIEALEAGAEGRTTISFTPDLARLGVPSDRIDGGNLEVIQRRVVDMAGCAISEGQPTTVLLNGTPVPVDGFEAYTRLFVGSDCDEVAFVRVNDRWEVGVRLSPTREFTHTSFVNCMATPRGGTHGAWLTFC